MSTNSCLPGIDFQVQQAIVEELVWRPTLGLAWETLSRETHFKALNTAWPIYRDALIGVIDRQVSGPLVRQIRQTMKRKDRHARKNVPSI